jgi:L-iditol 2-dehydrogenase
MRGELPARMRTAVVHGWGDVRIEERPVPVPGPGEAVFRIEACGLCGSDAMPWYVDSKAPVVLGHEPAGVIVAVADDVHRFAPGDRVFVHHHAPCLDCPECARGLWSNCATWRSTRLDPGGFAEYARVSATNLETDTLRLPDSVDFETATFIEPVACCLRAVRRKGEVSPADAVHIIGLGAMGLVMIQLVRALGAARITAADFDADRRRLGLELGADEVLDPAADDADIRAAAPGGRVVCFTPLAPDVPLTVDQNRMYFREITLLQSYSSGPDETRSALDLLAADAIDTGSLLTHRGGLDGVAAGLDRALSKKDGIKTVILPNG